MVLNYKTRGVCCKSIDLEVEDNIIKSVKFNGGCQGNTAAISALVVGENVDKVVDKLNGIRCGDKLSSCPNELVKALNSLRV